MAKERNNSLGKFGGEGEKVEKIDNSRESFSGRGRERHHVRVEAITEGSCDCSLFIF